jgi:hypothetical protein
MRPRGSAGKKTRGQVHSQNAVPGLVGFVGKHFAGAAAGIIDEDVQAAVRFHRLSDCRFHGFAIGDVTREKSYVAAVGADRFLDSAAFGFAAGEDGYFGSFLRETAGGGFADAAVASGNHGHFVLQTTWHPKSPRVEPSGRILVAQRIVDVLLESQIQLAGNDSESG